MGRGRLCADPTVTPPPRCEGFYVESECKGIDFGETLKLCAKCLKLELIIRSTVRSFPSRIIRFGGDAVYLTLEKCDAVA